MQARFALAMPQWRLLETPERGSPQRLRRWRCAGQADYAKTLRLCMNQKEGFCIEPDIASVLVADAVEKHWDQETHCQFDANMGQEISEPGWSEG